MKIEKKIQFHENEIKQSNEEKKISWFFATKISNLLDLLENTEIENPENIEYDEKLKKFLYKIFRKAIKNTLEENKENYPFLEKKYFEEQKSENENISHHLSSTGEAVASEKKEKILNGNFEKKFSRYFDMHIKYIIDSMLKDIDIEKLKYEKDNDKEKELENKREVKYYLKNFISNNIKKYSEILFIFWEKIKISNLVQLLEKDSTIITSKFNEVNDKISKLEDLEKKYDLWIEPLETYRSILSQVIFSENEELKSEDITLEIKEEVNNLFIKQTRKLYNVFYNWKKNPFVDENQLKNIANFANDFFNLTLAFKEAWIAFNESFYINELNNENKKTFLINFINSFFEKITDDKKIREDNKELFIKFLEITINAWDYSEMIEEIKEYKKNKYKNEIPDNKEQLTEEEVKEIENNIWNIDFDDWYKIPDNQRYKIFFEKILYKSWENIEINLELLEIENINDDDVKLFSKYKDVSENVTKNQLKKIKQNYKNFSSLKNFIEDDVNNLQLLVAWFRFILKKKKLEKEEKKINVENLLNIEDKPYWVRNRIAKKLEEKVKWEWNIEFLFWSDRPINDSHFDVENDLHAIKISFEKWDIDLKNNVENIEAEKISFKEYSELYIIKDEKKSKDAKENLKYNYNRSLKYNKLALLVCNKLLSWENFKNKEEKEYVDKLIKLKIISKDYQNLDLKTSDNLQVFREFLKYVNYKIKILYKMMETWIKDKEKLKKYLPENKEFAENKSRKTEIWQDKKFSRWLEKLIKDYTWDFGRLWDFTRARIINDWIDDTIKSVVEFILKLNDSDEITQVSIIDNTKNPLEKPEKASWYIDVKLLVKFTTWNVAEVQFQYKEMLEMKEKWVNFEENDFIFQKFIDETEWWFTQEEINLLLTRVDKELLFKKGILEKLSDDDINIWELDSKKTIISTQDTYKIARIFKNTSEWTKEYSLYEKITRLERILASIAWGRIVTEYLKSNWINLE